LNNQSSYNKNGGDHIALVLGFAANSYLVSTFVSTNWIHTSIGQALCTGLVVYFLCFKESYALNKILPAFMSVMISCAANSYYIELSGKKQFLEQ